VTRLAAAIARALLELALGILFFGLALVFLAWWIAGAPYRRRRGPSTLEAVQQLVVALAGLTAALRGHAATTAARSPRDV
jgi:Co/Zn/Cd efflux system component